MEKKKKGKLLAVPWARLKDDPNCKKMKHNFIQDERNPWPMDGRKWLKEKLMKTQALSKKKKVQNRKKMEEWRKQVVEFQELLLILVHLTGKQLVKSLEVLSIRHSSLGKGKGRNMFVEDRVVATVTQYHKSYMLSSDVKIIHWYLPWKGEKLVVYYL